VGLDEREVQLQQRVLGDVDALEVELGLLGAGGRRRERRGEGEDGERSGDGAHGFLHTRDLNLNRTRPRVTLSLSMRSWVWMRLSFTNVPLVEPRSLILNPSAEP